MKLDAPKILRIVVVWIEMDPEKKKKKKNFRSLDYNIKIYNFS